jgi:aminoglycoside 6'-N-acetyltransferase I
VRKRLKPLGKEHFEGCAGLLVDAFSREPWNQPWTLEAAHRKLSEILSTPSFLGFISVQGKEPLGLVLGYRRAHFDGELFYLEEICVAPSAQSRGIGGRLLDRMEGELAGMGVDKVFLLTIKEGPAKAFYEKMGYRRSKTTVVMVKDLGGSGP